MISLRSRALACNLTAIASFIGLTAGIAADAIWWWPFLVTLLITGYGYLFGLGNYGVAEEGTPDDAGPERQTRSPVSS
jgi:fatty acid desaturase